MSHIAALPRLAGRALDRAATAATIVFGAALLAFVLDILFLRDTGAPDRTRP